MGFYESNSFRSVALFYRRSKGSQLVEFASLPAQQESGRVLFRNYSDLDCQRLMSLGSIAREQLFDEKLADSKVPCYLCEVLSESFIDLVLSSESSYEVTTKPQQTKQILSWMTFPNLSRLLNSGAERRILQLAVQYLSQEHTLDSLNATECNEQFMDALRRSVKPEKDI